VSGTAIGLSMFQLTLVRRRLFKKDLLKRFIRIAFQLVPLSSEFFSLLSYGLAITVQIFMYCWFGNEVEIKVK
jgi:hypothetical protein